jgi:hypothetical protein
MRVHFSVIDMEKLLRYKLIHGDLRPPSRLTVAPMLTNDSVLCSTCVH